MAQYLTLEDLRLARHPEAVLNLFRKLGYHVESDLIPLNPIELEFPAGAGIQRLFLLADHDQLQIFLFELDAVQMAHLRVLARDLLLRAGNYLIVTAPSAPPYDRLVFVNPRRIGAGLNLTVGIRKLVVEPAHPTRHDLDILEAIAAFGKADDPAALYQAQVQAFDVERLTNTFYRAYAGLFHRTNERIRVWNQAHPLLANPDHRRAFTQRLLNRLMFLYFMQRKGWLAGDRHFLTAWYQRLARDEGGYWANFLRPIFFDTLNRRRVGDGSTWGNIPYLNGGLFEPKEPDTDPGIYLPDELFDPRDAEGLLSFLNNYNFTVAEDTPLEQEVALDPEMLGKVFENLLEETERGQSGAFYTPRPIVHYMARAALRHYLADATGLLEERLAVLFGAGERGSEGAEEITNESSALQPSNLAEGTQSATFQPLTPNEAAKINAGLDTIRVLDPAVGSGALLVGMLHELVVVRQTCWQALTPLHPPASEGIEEGPPVTRWKRDFIANSLYGVDLKPEAVEIARLRLWLSLVVDQRREEVEPLPNLDYRLMVGNSLLETLNGEPLLLPSPSGRGGGGEGLIQGSLPGVPAPAQQLGLNLGESGRTRTGLAELKAEYFTAETRADRERLRQSIEGQERALVLAALDEKLANLRAKTQLLVDKGSRVNWQGMKKEERELADLANKQAKLTDLAAAVRQGEPLPFFLYRLHFFEVFRDKGGFDIVLANPPYVRQELIGDQKPALEKEYPQVYQGTADLYVYFYARGLNLLRPKGVLAYITSNKFMRTGYGKKLRQFLSKQTSLETIIDFGDLPVFEATAYPSIVIARKVYPSTEQLFEALIVNDIEVLEQLEEELPSRSWRLSQSGLTSDTWTLERPETLALMDKLRGMGCRFGEYIQSQFFNGVKTGLNEAFVIDEAVRIV